jgi:hypothetical protein
LLFGGEAISVSLKGIASGKEQKRPRKDMVSLGSEGTYIFTNPNDLSCHVNEVQEPRHSCGLID